MKLYFTRRTWYFLLLTACAASMANAIAVLTGTDLSFLEMCGFCMASMAMVFLAAEKDNTAGERKGCFFAFLAQLLSYTFGGTLGLLFSSLGWPILLFTLSRSRCAPASLPFRVCVCAEEAHFLILLCTPAEGGGALYAAVNFLWLSLTAVRGWGALTLCRSVSES